MSSVAKFLSVLCVFVCLAVPSARADIVVLQTGERLIGEITSQNDEAIILEHPILGTLTLNAADVRSVIVQADEMPEPEADVPQVVAEAPQVPPVPEQEPAPEWKSRVELGFNASDGNTENANLTLSFKTTRDTPDETTTFDAAYYFAENSGVASENKATLGVNHDWKFKDSPWLLFARARYDYDEFNSWRSRVTGAGGVGYTFYDTDDFRLIGRAGLGANREFDSLRNGIRAEGLAGFDLLWKIDPTQEFIISSTYYADFEDTGEFRVLTTAGWKLDMPQFDGASVFLGLRHEYQSLVDPGQEETDVLIFGGLGIDF